MPYLHASGVKIIICSIVFPPLVSIELDENTCMKHKMETHLVQNFGDFQYFEASNAGRPLFYSYACKLFTLAVYQTSDSGRQNIILNPRILVKEFAKFQLIGVRIEGMAHFVHDIDSIVNNFGYLNTDVRFNSSVP